MKLIGQLLAAEAIIAAFWAVTNDDHDIGFLIGLMIAGALIVWSARRGRCVR